MAAEDWDDPNWVSSPASRSIAGDDRRDPGRWERAHFLYGLDRCGVLTGLSRILVAATMPDELIAILTEHAGRVDVLGLEPRVFRGPAEARLFWSNGGLYARDRLVVLNGTVDELTECAYDAVVFPHSAICCGGLVGMARLMEKAEQLLAPGGVLAFKAEILAGVTPHPDHLDMALVREDHLVHWIERETGFAIEGGFDVRLPRGEPVLSADSGANKQSEFVREHNGRLAVPSIWFFRKRGSAPGGGWDKIEASLLQRLLGDQLHRLHLGAAGCREESGRIVTRGSAKGCIFFGPYLVLPRGRYEAIVEVEPLSATRRGRLVLDVAAGGRRLNRSDLSLAGMHRVVERLPFELPSPSLGRVQRVEIRAWSNGCAAAFTACGLVEPAR